MPALKTMRPDSRPAFLVPEEWRLVWALREVPEGRLRVELLRLLDELLDVARDPHCAEMQADGVPCACLGVACDECQRVVSRLRQLRLPMRSV
jgi:hypothetical protein